MSRLVIKHATGPVMVGDKEICMCGLSKNQPYCDESHKRTKDEAVDSTYLYNDKTREEVAAIELADAETECQCCCGDESDECCQNDSHDSKHHHETDESSENCCCEDKDEACCHGKKSRSDCHCK